MDQESEDRLVLLLSRMEAVESLQRKAHMELQDLKNDISSNTTSLKEFIEIAGTLKVGLKLLGYVESAAVWLVKVGGAIGIVWAVWKYLIKETLENVNK